MHKRIYPLLILPALILSWLLATIFIDLMAVPLVFQTVSSRDEAANLGIQIFRRFNLVEIALLILITFSFISSKIFKVSDYLKSFSYLLFFPIFYFTYLTDKIVHFNALKANEIDEEKLSQIQSSLDFYHHLYVRLDSLKIVFLLISFIYIVIFIAKYFKNNMEAK